MNILITGKNGYVANRLLKFLNNQRYFKRIDSISVRDNVDIHKLEGYDTCIHTSALVHKKENNYTEADYFLVNTELTIDLARKAKEQGIKHFIFLSTMAVYGVESGEITATNTLMPKTFYGKSKLAAEHALLDLQDDKFTVSIVRPPMVYGPNCPGNYVQLRKLAKRTLIFPKVHNQRSMLFIDNLCEFLLQLINYRDSGIFHPQDANYMNSSKLVSEIARYSNHRVFFSKAVGFVLTNFFSNVSLINKVFGNLTYSKGISTYRDNSYQQADFKAAIQKTERDWDGDE